MDMPAAMTDGIYQIILVLGLLAAVGLVVVYSACRAYDWLKSKFKTGA